VCLVPLLPTWFVVDGHMGHMGHMGHIYKSSSPLREFLRYQNGGRVQGVGFRT